MYHALTSGGDITGKLDLNVPPFLQLDHDTEGRRLTLTIEDNEQKKQKEMWGTIYTAARKQLTLAHQITFH